MFPCGSEVTKLGPMAACNVGVPSGGPSELVPASVVITWPVSCKPRQQDRTANDFKLRKNFLDMRAYDHRDVTYGDTNTARTRPESIFGIMKPIFAMDRPELYVPHAGWFRHEPDDEVARFLSEEWFEYKEQAFLWLYLRPGDTFLDGGAHVGLYSVVAGRALNNSGTIVAVEPHPARSEE